MENKFFVDSEYLSPEMLKRSMNWKKILQRERTIWNICPVWKLLNLMSVKKS